MTLLFPKDFSPFFSFLFFKLQDDCITMLYWFLPYKNRNQSKLFINIYSLFLEPPFPILSHFFKQSHRATWLLYSRFPLTVCFTHTTFSVFPTLSFFYCVHKSILYVCVSIPSLQIGSSVLFFQIPHQCINMQ